MTRTIRLFTGLFFVEMALAAIWYWLVAGIISGDMRTSVPAEQAIRTVSAVMGGAMGVIAALVLTVWLFTLLRPHAS